MGNRGRTSQAAKELKVVAGATPDAAILVAIERPSPPSELTSEQAEEWIAVTERLPADWFPRETFPLLAQYCRHVVASRRVAALIEDVETGEDGLDVDEYDKLLKMQEREGRAISSLATRMRITQQTTYDKSRKKGTAGRKKPWEDAD